MSDARMARFISAYRNSKDISDSNIAGVSERFIQGGPFSRDALYDAIIAEMENPSGALKRLMVERAVVPPETVGMLLDEADRVGYVETPAMMADGKMGYDRTHKYRHDAFIEKYKDDISNAMLHYAKTMWDNPHIGVDYFWVSKYTTGGHFAPHTDNSGKGHRRRVSVSVGLNSDYDGGELVVAGKPMKLGAGDVVAFTSNLPHWVTPVTRGERINIVLFLIDKRNMQPWEAKDGSWY